MPGISHLANVPLNSLATSSTVQHIYCPVDPTRPLPEAVRIQLPEPPCTKSIFDSIPASDTTSPAPSSILPAFNRDENGESVPPTTSEITKKRTLKLLFFVISPTKKLSSRLYQLQSNCNSTILSVRINSPNRFMSKNLGNKHCFYCMIRDTCRLESKSS